MATFNITYHHTIIHYNYNCNKLNSPNFCPNLPFNKTLNFPRKKHHIFAAISKNVTQESAMPFRIVKEVLPPVLDSSSDPPSIFDGNPKLYISYNCPYAQRVWITRNCKGLQETIKLIPIDLKNRPSWYKEKVYPANKVPALEYNNEVKGESLDLIRYLDENFEGPSLFPAVKDPTKREFGEELLSSVGSFYKAVITSLKANRTDDTGMLFDSNGGGAAFDDIEIALSKFDDEPFFLGQFSLVDIAFIPFIERIQPFFSEIKNFDITGGRQKLALWIKEMNKIEGYTQTRRDPKEHVESYKRRFLSNP